VVAVRKTSMMVCALCVWHSYMIALVMREAAEGKARNEMEATKAVSSSQASSILILPPLW
jgi:hypothetical protein